MENKETYETIQMFRDDLDKWLFEEFGVLGGCCSSIESLKYNIAREVAEKAIEYGKQQLMKETVSEELENELNKYIKDYFTIDREQLDRFGIEEKDYMYSMDKSDMLALVEHFTNWQQERDEADRAAVYKCGWNDRKAMMMKKSFDAKILPANIEETEFCLDDYEEVAIIIEMVNKGEFKMGDKVKVIVIKDD